MYGNPLHTGLNVILTIAGTIVMLLSLALEYPFYRMLLILLIVAVLLAALR